MKMDYESPSTLNRGLFRFVQVDFYNVMLTLNALNPDIPSNKSSLHV